MEIMEINLMFQENWLPFAGGALILLLLILILVFWRRKKRKSRSTPQPLTLGLAKSRLHLGKRLESLWRPGNALNDEALSEIEAILIQADVGVATTQKLLLKIQESGSRFKDLKDLKEFLAQEILKLVPRIPERPANQEKPQVMMIVGINGVGKTTSIAKLAHHYQNSGQKIMLAAADTFRAGAVNQLKVWAERIDVAILAQSEGADPAAVAFDAVQSGQAKGMDRVIIDTAGRLHTKVNLMEELKKVQRVIGKAMPGAPHETWLVIDGTQGQNALQQARQFHQALGLTGLILTKLDGTAKGGIILAISDELKVPITFIGVGEKMQDLRPFEAESFIKVLLED